MFPSVEPFDHVEQWVTLRYLQTRENVLNLQCKRSAYVDSPVLSQRTVIFKSIELVFGQNSTKVNGRVNDMDLVHRETKPEQAKEA